MTTLREAAQQALEALQEYQSNGAPFLACDGAIDALRAALAQQDEPVWMHPWPPVRAQQDEPVAWLTPGQDLHLNNGEGFRFSDWTPLYPAPPQRKPLTQEEIDRICASLGFAAISPAEIVRAVERAHGIGETK